MENLKDYKEYESLFNDDLVVVVRKILQRIEDNDGYLMNFEDGREHNELKRFFNKFYLHSKLTKDEYKTK